MPIILYNAADLIWATRIKSTAEALGVMARPARNTDMLAARLADSEVSAILLDLDAPDAAWDLLDMLRGPDADPAARRVRVICWGPHVAVELFQQARDRGADDILTRGAFSSTLPDLLVRLASGAPSSEEDPSRG